MPNFQYLNLTLSDTLGATSNLTSAATSNVLNNVVTGANSPTSLVMFGTVDVASLSAAVMASASAVTDSGGDLLFTKASHGFYTGLVGQFTTSVTLPTGISALTDYYIIRVSANTFKVATSLANAQAGTAVAYTDAGTGNQTFTATALAGATLKLKGSFDGTNYCEIPNASVSITADASFVVEVDYIRYASYRADLAITSGQISSISPLQIGYRGGE